MGMNCLTCSDDVCCIFKSYPTISQTPNSNYVLKVFTFLQQTLSSRENPVCLLETSYGNADLTNCIIVYQPRSYFDRLLL
jgi:hypothetical protein